MASTLASAAFCLSSSGFVMVLIWDCIEDMYSFICESWTAMWVLRSCFISFLWVSNSEISSPEGEASEVFVISGAIFFAFFVDVEDTGSGSFLLDDFFKFISLEEDVGGERDGGHVESGGRFFLPK